MSNLKLPTMSFAALTKMGLPESGAEKKLAYATTVRVGTVDGDRGFVVRHHQSDIAFITESYVSLFAAWHSVTTAGRLHKILRDNAPEGSPWGIGIRQGVTELRNYYDKSLSQQMRLATYLVKKDLMSVDA